MLTLNIEIKIKFIYFKQKNSYNLFEEGFSTSKYISNDTHIYKENNLGSQIPIIH